MLEGRADAERRVGEAIFHAGPKEVAVVIAAAAGVDVRDAAADVEAQIVVGEDAILDRTAEDVYVVVVVGRPAEPENERSGRHEVGEFAAKAPRIRIAAAAAIGM